MKAPFGVHDNGEITNPNGETVGHLVEGEPQELVGTAIKNINEDGQLQAENGSIIGKAELKSESPDKAGETSEEKPEDSEEKQVSFQKHYPRGRRKLIQLQDDDSPEEEDLSILKGKKVNKMGKIVDEEVST